MIQILQTAYQSLVYILFLLENYKSFGLNSVINILDISEVNRFLSK